MKRFFATMGMMLIMASVAVPVYAQVTDTFKDKGLIPCGNPGQEMCEFSDVIKLVNNIIKFLIWVSIPLAVIAFTYAGFLMVTSGGNPGQIDKAKGIFRNVAIGLVFVISAWLIVYLIISNLVEKEIYETFF